MQAGRATDEGETTPDRLATVRHYFGAAADSLGLNKSLRILLWEPFREVFLTIPVTLENHETVEFPAYRVQHSGARGPYRAGLQFGPRLNASSVRADATIETWTGALLDLPFGGGMWGVRCPIATLSSLERQRMTRALVQEVARDSVAATDVLGPDLNTGPREMGWTIDEEYNHSGVALAIVGKPQSLLGSFGQEAARGRGIAYLLREVMPRLDLSATDMRFLVDHFNEVGSSTARILEELGLTMIATSDGNEAIRTADGIDSVDLLAHLNAGGALGDYPGVEVVDPADVLGIECEAAVLTASRARVEESTARDMRCRVVVEGAKGVLTPTAEAVLNENGTVVIPDLLAAAGGSVVAYLEYVQDLQRFRWGEREVNDRLGHILRSALRQVDKRAEKTEATLRTVAYEIALERIAEAVVSRGY